MLNSKYFFFNIYQERSMVIWDEEMTGIILDPGFVFPEEKIAFLNFIRKNGIKPVAILLTHAHFDHLYGVQDCVSEFGIPVYMHPADKIIKDNMELFMSSNPLDRPALDWDTIDVNDSDIISFSSISLKVIHTPGHSPGSVCYYSEETKDLFTGDTLFSGTIGRTDLRWGNYDDEIVSIMDKIMGLPSDVAIHPGHGGGSTIGRERTNNAFLMPFNEKDENTGAVDGITFSIDE